MKKIIILLSTLLILFSCVEPEQEKIDTEKPAEIIHTIKQEPVKREEVSGEYIDIYNDKIVNTILSKFSGTGVILKDKQIKTPSYNMPTSYLEDELEFNTLDYGKWEDQNIGIIGKDGVYLYNDIIAPGEPDFSTLDRNKILTIPKGTIIPINGVYTCDEYYEEGPCQYNDMLNFWYKTTYNGQEGIVFGAYIAFYADEDGFNYRPDYVMRKAYYYNKAEKADAFYDFCGARVIPQNIQQCLIQDKIAFERVSKKEYYLSQERPDDLIALYQTLHNDPTTNSFLTTDLIIHCLHLLFDRMLESAESEVFFPILVSLVDDYLSVLKDMEAKTPAEHTVLANAITQMQNYFSIPEAIVKAGQEAIKQESANKKREEDGEEPLPIEVDTESMFKDYPEAVKEELSLILSAEGFKDSPLFGYKEDYSQFKPRGHYTKSELLKYYFRAMMWFGRLHFYIDDSEEKDDPLNKDAKTRKELSLELLPSALLLNKIAKENQEILKKWCALFDPITYVVGTPDDLVFYDILKIIDVVDLNDFGNWLQKEYNLLSFIKLAKEELPAPGIQGNFMLEEKTIPIEEEKEPPRGFRFMGQRFTLDNYIHNRLCSPRIGTFEKQRTMVKGLDVMGVLGNTLAPQYLSDDMENILYYKENYYLLYSTIKNFKQLAWRQTFFNGYLRLVKELTTFEKGVGFYFTQGDKWDTKALLTSHASWAELRHDTILYVKQSYAGWGGGGDPLDFDLDPIPKPINYVEPNLGFFYWLQTLLEDSIALLSNNGFMNDIFQIKFRDFQQITDTLTEIVELEASDRPISEEQNNFILTVPNKLARIILPSDSAEDIGDEGIGDGEDAFKMPVVADVHTDGFENVVLEVATGIPYRIYVALNDGQGGKRIAIGYTYSYYEFTQPMDNRLNDDQWREMVYKEGKDLDAKLPVWAQDILCQ